MVPLSQSLQSRLIITSIQTGLERPILEYKCNPCNVQIARTEWRPMNANLCGCAMCAFIRVMCNVSYANYVQCEYKCVLKCVTKCATASYVQYEM